MEDLVTPVAEPALSIRERSALPVRVRDFAQGELVQTGEALDLAIDGQGFFEVVLFDGRRAYTRCGSMKCDRFRTLVMQQNLPYTGGFQPIPLEATSIAVAPDGNFRCDGPSSRTSFRIQLVRFEHPESLRAIGANLFVESSESGTAEISIPGENGCGELRQGFIEASNVRPEEELMELVELQKISLSRVRKGSQAARL